MLQLDKLRQLCNVEHSGVASVKKQIHLALEPSFLSDINLGIVKCLNSHMHEYYPEVSGILLGYDQVKLKKSTGAMYSDQPHIHVDIQAIFFIFTPSTGNFLLGTVNKKSDGHVGVLVHDTFNASILKSGSTPVKSWAGSKVSVGMVVRFRVLSISYSRSRPVILGELDKETMQVGEREVIVDIIEEVSDFEGDSEHDSGIENGKRKNKEVPSAVTAAVNGEPSGSSGSKRKIEDEVEDEVERKRRKKAEKKARKEKERLEKSKQTMVNGDNDDSSDEFQEGRKIKPDNSCFTPLLEPDLLTPKPKIKTALVSSPKTPKNPKDTFELPEGFKVIEKKTEKNSWKVYQGPDGKNYRSMVEVKRYLEGCTYDEEKLGETIEYVATDWNCSEKGDLGSDKSRFYSADFKDFPKSDLYYVDVKPSPSKKAQVEKTKTVVETSTTNVEHAEPSNLNSTFDDTIDSKDKKKKKKNEHAETFHLNGTFDDTTDSKDKKKKKKKKKHKESVLE